MSFQPSPSTSASAVKNDSEDATTTAAATSAAIASLSGKNQPSTELPIKQEKEEEKAAEGSSSSLQQQQQQQQQQEEERQPSLPMENEPDYDDSLVILDWCKLLVHLIGCFCLVLLVLRRSIFCN